MFSPLVVGPTHRSLSPLKKQTPPGHSFIPLFTNTKCLGPGAGGATVNKANLPAFCLPHLEKKQEDLVTVLPSVVGSWVTSDSFLFKTREKGWLDIEMLAPISLT